MSQRTFSLIASVVFGLIALGHVLRIVFNLSFVVQDISVPNVGKRGRDCYLGLSCLPGFSAGEEVRGVSQPEEVGGVSE
jgi:hypothetical protein